MKTLEGKVETELSEGTASIVNFKSAKVQVPFAIIKDGKELLIVSVLALINGKEFQIGMKTIEIQPSKDDKLVDIEFDGSGAVTQEEIDNSDDGNDGNDKENSNVVIPTITGNLSISYKLLKLTTLNSLVNSNRGVCGVTVRGTFVGEVSASSIGDIKIRLKDSKGNMLGANKLPIKAPSIFMQLSIDSLVKNLDLQVSEGATVHDVIPLNVYKPLAVKLKLSNGSYLLLSILFTREVSRPSMMIHEVAMMSLDAGNKESPMRPLSSLFLDGEGNASLKVIHLEPVLSTTPLKTESEVLTGICNFPIITADASLKAGGIYAVSSSISSDLKTTPSNQRKGNILYKLENPSVVPQLHALCCGVATVNDPSISFNLHDMTLPFKLNAHLVQVNFGKLDKTSTAAGQSNDYLGHCALEEVSRVKGTSDPSSYVIQLDGTINGKIKVRAFVTLLFESPLPVKEEKKETETNGDPADVVSIDPSTGKLLSKSEELMSLSRAVSHRTLSRVTSSKLLPSNSQEIHRSIISGDQEDLDMIIESPLKRDINGLSPELDMEHMNSDYRGGNRNNSEFGDIVSPLNFAGHKREVHASKAIADIFRNELIEKQRMIDVLMAENASKGDALEECGKSIQALRRENMNIQMKTNELDMSLKSKLQNEVDALEVVENNNHMTDKISTLNRPTLLNLVVKLGNDLQRANDERMELKSLVAEGQSSRRQLEALQDQFTELQNAHLEQSKHIQSMKKQQSRVETYRGTIKMQEKVIAKLQILLETRLENSKPGDRILSQLMDKLDSQGKDSYDSWSEKVSELQSISDAKERELIEVKSTNNALQAKLWELEGSRDVLQSSVNTLATNAVEAEKTDDSFDFFESRKRIDELEAECTSKDYRISAMENQLRLQAEEYSREIARLRMKLFEFEMIATMGFDDQLGKEDDYEFSQLDMTKDVSTTSLVGVGDAGNVPAGAGSNVANAMRKLSKHIVNSENLLKDMPTGMINPDNSPNSPNDVSQLSRLAIEDSTVKDPQIQANPELGVEPI